MVRHHFGTLATGYHWDGGDPGTSYVSDWRDSPTRLNIYIPTGVWWPVWCGTFLLFLYNMYLTVAPGKETMLVCCTIAMMWPYIVVALTLPLLPISFEESHDLLCNSVILIVGVYVYILLPRRKIRKNLWKETQDLNPLLSYSGVQLSEMIKQHKVSCKEVVQAYIAQIETTDPLLNALCGKRFKEAIEEAQNVDDLVTSSSKPDARPLLGVPILIKECHEMVGLPFTNGLLSRMNVVGQKDCTAVKRIREGGMIVLGNTNTSECCMWMECYNLVYGRTNNPYDLACTSGGSSGGGAAAVAACATPLALTSDVGGSTRIPGHFCGIFGHKPTGGTVPNTGTLPTAKGMVRRYCQLGPTTRHAEDLMPFLRCMAGPDDFDSHCRPDVVSGWDKLDGLQGIRVVSIMEVCGGSMLVSRRHSELCSAHERVTTFLEAELKCKVIRYDTDPKYAVEYKELRGLLADSFQIWSAMMSAGGNEAFRRILVNPNTTEPTNKPALALVWELVLVLLGQGRFTLPAVGLGLVEQVPEMMPSETHRLAALGEKLREKLTALVGDGVLLYPSLPTLAPAHNELLVRILDAGATGLFNVMELPATQIPLGLSTTGLPLGIQVVGGIGSDHKTIAVAELLQKHGIARWTAPPRPLAAGRHL
jgi:fatty acid amide hydrolase 2